MHIRTKIGEKGRIVIPADMREKLGIKPGDIVEISMGEHELRIKSFPQRLLEIQQRMAKYATTGKLWSDELIADRREEARREEEEAERALQPGTRKRKLKVG